MTKQEAWAAYDAANKALSAANAEVFELTQAYYEKHAVIYGTPCLWATCTMNPQGVRDVEETYEAIVRAKGKVDQARQCMDMACAEYNLYKTH